MSFLKSLLTTTAAAALLAGAAVAQTDPVTTFSSDGAANAEAEADAPEAGATADPTISTDVTEGDGMLAGEADTEADAAVDATEGDGMLAGEADADAEATGDGAAMTAETEGGAGADTETGEVPTIAAEDQVAPAEGSADSATEMAADTEAQDLFDYSAEYAALADMPIDDVVGLQILAQNGDEVGEVDNVGVMNAEPVILVGVGGFLGIGEHNIALALDEMSYDAEENALVVSGYTRDELKQMPEYDESQIGLLEGDAPLSQVWSDGAM